MYGNLLFPYTPFSHSPAESGPLSVSCSSPSHAHVSYLRSPCTTTTFMRSYHIRLQMTHAHKRLGWLVNVSSKVGKE